ncbi:MAG TPA: YtxH domain-containing protein [Candidatus Deferrimicrobiaceae bacterium]
MDERDDNVMTGALLVLAGVILGAGVALLLAPQSGKETRRDLTRYARKGRRKIEGVAGEVAESVAALADAVEGKAEELLDRGKDLAKESRQAVLDALEEGQGRIQRQRERLEKLLG